MLEENEPVFLFSINIKVTVIIRGSNLNWEEKRRGFWVKVTLKHIRACECRITPMRQKQSAQGPSVAGGLMDREARMGSVLLQTSGAVFNANPPVCCRPVMTR